MKKRRVFDLDMPDRRRGRGTMPGPPRFRRPSPAGKVSPAPDGARPARHAAARPDGDRGSGECRGAEGTGGSRGRHPRRRYWPASCRPAEGTGQSSTLIPLEPSTRPS